MTPTSIKPKVFGTGLIALDLVIGADTQSTIRNWAGGTCGNVLSILAYLGWDAYPVARMNGDMASIRVQSDMAKLGVHLDLINCAPVANTPIIVQVIKRSLDGSSKHRFSLFCPHCSKYLPPFKPITKDAAERVKDELSNASVFFLDQLSRGALNLAIEASACGAMIVFEPSGLSSEKLMTEALELAHIIKYADNRLSGIPGAMASLSANLLEIQTLGSHGLRYRHRLSQGLSNWIHLKALRAPRVADTCGSGDWCTAGLIAKVGVDGYQGLRLASARSIRATLRYGQALAAWNCGFEGARGGMYIVSRRTFERQINRLLNGESYSVTQFPTSADLHPIVICPACPSTQASG